MNAHDKGPDTLEVLRRLDVLQRKLTREGLYVRANTVGQAIDVIRRSITPQQTPQQPGIEGEAT